MREKIERFSNGEFEYELPFLCLSEEELLLSVEAGKVYEGSFTVACSTGRPVKGHVYSSGSLMLLENADFSGTENTVHYSFNASAIKAGSLLHGEFNIVSDCGEKTLPFSVQAEVSYFMSSLGKIKDLFQFTNLARMDWADAKRIFRSEDFERSFLANEDRFRFIYRNLMKSISTSQALEEFLIAIHKKAAIRLDVDKTQVEYTITQDKLPGKLVLTKNHWGYAEILVSTDAAFIQLEQKYLWADRFIGNTHQITYVVDSRYLRHGNNFGHIWIRTPHQTIEVNLLCRYKTEIHKVSENRLRQKAEFDLTDNYLSFRLNRISLPEYITETEKVLERLTGPETNCFKDLIRTHLAIISGKNQLAEELLSDFGKEEIILKKRSVPEYCTYLYLKSLYYKDDATIENAAETIRNYYLNGYFDWKILWLLLYIDKRYEKNRNLKLADIKEQFDAGCRSPILYYEAVCIINEEPYLLRELSSFEIQALNFGIKNWILAVEAAKQYTYLAGKSKTFDQVVFHCLVKLYDEYDTPDTLSVICCTLIKGMKKEHKYFEWYRLGVEAQLHITELYEYYMYSADEAMQEPFSMPVLLYFIYNNSLSNRLMAFLYANIVRNKELNETIYRSYYKKIEVFTEKMLEGHYINHDLAVLYHEFLISNSLRPELVNHLPYVMFRQELVCDNPNMVSVIVIHKELEAEETVPLVNGRAQINIYTSNVEIFLVDSLGNRFVESVEYTVTPYLKAEELENQCAETSSNPMLLLHLFDRYQSYRIMHDKAIELRKKVLLIEGLSKEYVTYCQQTLIEHYYENFDDEQLEYYLNQLDLYRVRPADRTKYLEFMVIRAFYQKAFEAFQAFGFEGIPINRMVKLCSGWLAKPANENREDFMITLCYYAFSHGKYDETILKYLIKYYNGSTGEMYRLWQAARDFELESHILEERLLTQMLFSESYIEDSFLVFSNYYKAVTNRTLVRAYLTFYAYKYLVHDQVVNPELFPVMKRELFYDENDICLLAWLKFHAADASLSENEKIFAEYNIHRLVKKQIILPFFLQYRNRITLPERILDKCYISYQADPEKHIYIHYRLLADGEQDYITERIPDIFMGIHVKEYMLFHHEALQYYITEEADEETNITESFHLQYDCETPEDDESNYNQINLMLITKEMQDENTLLEMMENFTIKQYLTEACFQQID